jgi:hypothetical protein
MQEVIKAVRQSSLPMASLPRHCPYGRRGYYDGRYKKSDHSIKQMPVELPGACDRAGCADSCLTEE